jgi:hypothetical protein
MYCLYDIYSNISDSTMHFQCYYCSFPTGKYRDLISHLIENHTMDEIECVQGRKQGRDQGKTIKIDDKNL